MTRALLIASLSTPPNPPNPSTLLQHYQGASCCPVSAYQFPVVYIVYYYWGYLLAFMAKKGDTSGKFSVWQDLAIEISNENSYNKKTEICKKFFANFKYTFVVGRQLFAINFSPDTKLLEGMYTLLSTSCCVEMTRGFIICGRKEWQKLWLDHLECPCKTF